MRTSGDGDPGADSLVADLAAEAERGDPGRRRPVHPAGPATAANYLVTAIRARTPDWIERVENSSWVTEDPDPEEHGPRWIAVAVGQHDPSYGSRPRGPEIVALARDVELRMKLPDLLDGTDTSSVLETLAAWSVLPGSE